MLHGDSECAYRGIAKGKLDQINPKYLEHF